MTADRQEDHPRVEELAAEFHAVYQVEARRQGDVRHHDDYAVLPENIKEFDRVLARHVLARERGAHAQLEQMREAAKEFSSEAVLSVCRPQRLAYWRSRFAALAAVPDRNEDA